MRLLPLAAVAAMLSTTLLASADTMTTLNASGTFTSGSILSGTLTLDETSGVFTAADLTVSGPDSLSFNAVVQECGNPTPNTCLVQAGEGNPYVVPVLDLILTVGSFIGYEGGSIASTSAPSAGYISDIYGPGDLLVRGSVSTPSPTPEPSSLALLGTGLLIATWLCRKRVA